MSESAQVANANKRLGWRSSLFRVFACEEPGCFALYRMSGGPEPYPGPYPVIHGTIRDCLIRAGMTKEEVDHE